MATPVLLRDRPDHYVRSDAGRIAMIGFLSVYDATGVEYIVSNGVLDSRGVANRVNSRYATDITGNPVLLTSG